MNAQMLAHHARFRMTFLIVAAHLKAGKVPASAETMLESESGRAVRAIIVSVHRGETDGQGACSECISSVQTPPGVAERTWLRYNM